MQGHKPSRDQRVLQFVVKIRREVIKTPLAGRIQHLLQGISTKVPGQHKAVWRDIACAVCRVDIERIRICTTTFIRQYNSIHSNVVSRHEEWVYNKHDTCRFHYTRFALHEIVAGNTNSIQHTLSSQLSLDRSRWQVPSVQAASS